MVTVCCHRLGISKKKKEKVKQCVYLQREFHSIYFCCLTLRLLTFSRYQLLSSLFTYEIENEMILPLSERKLELWGEGHVEFKSCIVENSIEFPQKTKNGTAL